MTYSRIVDLVLLPVAARDLGRMAKQMEREHGKGLTLSQEGQWLVVRTPGTVCGCLNCDELDRADLVRLSADPFGWPRFMIVCPDCGNKRCPRATHHDNPCTRSNEAGQAGSAYENVTPINERTRP